MNKKKNKAERSAQMQEVSAGLQEVLGMNQWHQEHPKATLREIEEAVDERMNQVRAQLIQEIAQMSAVEEWSQGPEEERPTCTRCGTVLVSRGKQTRWLQTNGGEALKLERSYGTCPDCGQGIFPPG
jgi:ribosomal protein S27AE